MLLVEILKNILVLEEPEDSDHLFETRINLDITGHTLQALAEHVIHEERQVLGSSCILIQERFECLLQRQLEVLALLERLFHKLVVLVLEVQDRRDERNGILHLFRVAEDIPACIANAIDHDPLHFLQRLRDSAEQQVHPLQVLYFVVLEHPRAARVFHVDECLVMRQNPLLIAQLLNFLHGGLMEVILDPSLFLTNALFGLLEVVGASVLGDVLHRFVLIELPRVIQKLVFETLAVNVLALNAELHEHVHCMLQKNAVYLLAPTFSGNVLQHQSEESSAYSRVPRHVLAEDDQSHLIHRYFLVL
mmetsp:Transcript_93686/g.260816  ORF Transcript_93686/g.260816 Transcript_93686/m.260816 type:complete len:305 (-) Transcript_93686:496-1410(-)